MEKRRVSPFPFSSYSVILYSMINKVLNYVKEYQMIEAGDMVVAGISGGADSVCLLFVLLEIRKKIPFTLRAVHVNHKIRPDASEDADYVRELCKRQGVPFYLVEEDVEGRAKEYGISTEEAGRRIRYRAFGEVLGGEKGKIAVAHNSNDRAETMLFHLFRGTGLAGAGGIRPVNGNVIRPVLCLSRKEIEGWLLERNISFCHDSTNAQDIYTRNRIRHHILTYAEEEICQGTLANMNRTADLLLEAQDYIDRQEKAAIKRCVKTGTGPGRVEIRIPELLKEDVYLRGCILLYCIGQAAGSRKDITAAHIRSADRLLSGERNGEIHLPYGLAVYKKYDLGMIQRKEAEDTAYMSGQGELPEHRITFPSVFEAPGLGTVEITVFLREYSQNIPQKTYTKWFDYDKITSSAMFRARRRGDYLTINNKMGHKSLQDYFVNEKIPRQERDKIYVLADGSHIMWVPGYRMSEYYKVREDTRKIMQVSILDKKI
ncbi:tRNA(Ile)-lysidine synthase [Lachnospiraceae bacterium]|nr:tRNA(Ile)-lysidine synthase [Lachnospiraceae bacterium]GFI69067.1 tRNA(Ile)-lysidine synthase [Lachnospiraceae bacterium]